MLNLPVPTQERSKKSLERFLNIAAELLANNEFEEAGVAQIAKLSDSSVGTFYRLLGDKDVLLFAVHERFVMNSRARINVLAEQLNSDPLLLTEKISAFIEGASDIFKNSEDLIRALIRRSSSDQNFRARIHQLFSHVCETFTQILMNHEDEFGHPEPKHAADLCAHMLLASMNYLNMVGTLGITPREAIPREIARLICSYLEVGQAPIASVKLRKSKT